MSCARVLANPLSGQDGGASFPGKTEATHVLCGTLGVTGGLLLVGLQGHLGLRGAVANEDLL